MFGCLVVGAFADANNQKNVKADVGCSSGRIFATFNCPGKYTLQLSAFDVAYPSNFVAVVKQLDGCDSRTAICDTSLKDERVSHKIPRKFDEVVLKTWKVTVVPENVFSLKFKSGRTKTSSKFSDPKKTKFITGSSYRIAPRIVDTYRSTVSEGNLDNITYRLAVGEDDEFFVSSRNGDVFGRFSEQGKHTLRLDAIDQGGETNLVEEYVFDVIDPPKFKLELASPRQRTPLSSVEYVEYDKGTTAYYVGRPFRVAPLKINAAETEFSDGSVSDMSFVLTGDEAVVSSVFVNSKTGDIFGQFARTGTFELTLVAIDKGKQTQPMEDYTFTVSKPPQFVLKTLKDRVQLAEPSVDYDDETTTYIVGIPYTIAPLKLNQSETQVSKGKLAEIRYQLMQAPVTFFVNSEKGQVFGIFKSAGDFKMDLMAIDGGGQEKLVEQYTFRVENPPVFRTTNDWDPAEEATKGGFKTEYVAGETYRTPEINRSKQDLFIQYAKDDHAKIAYTLEFSSTHVKPSARKALNPGTFLVDSLTGETLAQPEHPGRYSAEFVAKDVDGARATVFKWTFDVKPKRAFRTVPSWSSVRSTKKESMGPTQNYRSMYAQGETVKLSQPSLDADKLFENYAGGSAEAITYTMNFSRGDGTVDGSATSPGNFYVDSLGSVLAQPNRTGSFRGSLVARDKVGAVAIVHEWTFKVQAKDTTVDEFGPNDRPCANGGIAKDGILFDKNFTCDCSATKWIGDNCDAALACPNPTTQIAVQGLCQLCAPGSVPSPLESKCVLDPPCSKETSPLYDVDGGCKCFVDDALAASVRVHCDAVTSLPVLPQQTKRLRLRNVAKQVKLLRNTLQIAVLSADPEFVVLVEGKNLPRKPLQATTKADAGVAREDEAKCSDPAAIQPPDLGLCTAADSGLQTKMSVCSSKGAAAEGCDSRASLNQTLCPVGHFAAKDGSECKPCDRGGFHLAERGKVGYFSHCSCDTCTNGTYSPKAGASDPVRDCVICPAGTNTKFRADYRACRCIDGFSRVDRFGPCLSCRDLVGVTCSNDVRSLQNGNWWNFKSKEMLEEYERFAENLALSADYDEATAQFNGTMPPAYKCPTSANCLGGIKACCQEGTAGALCAVCDEGYFQINSDCLECPTSGWALAVTSAIAIVLVAVVAFVTRRIALTATKNIKKLELESEQAINDKLGKTPKPLGVDEPHPNDGGQHAWYKCGGQALFKIGLTFSQIVGVLTSVYTGVTWPALYRASTGGFKFLSSSPMSIMMMACISPSMTIDAYAAFRVAIIGPLMVALTALAFYLVARTRAGGVVRYCTSHTCQKAGCTADKSSDQQYCGGKVCTKKSKAPAKSPSTPDLAAASAGEAHGSRQCCHVGVRGRCKMQRSLSRANLKKAICVSVIALLFSLVYPMMTVNSVQILSECHQVCTDFDHTDCAHWMRADYSLDCDTSVHRGYMAVAGLVFAVVALGAPLALGFVLLKQRKRVLAKVDGELPSPTMFGLTVFYQPYKVQYMYWDAVSLLGKLFVTSMVVFVAPGSTLQLYAGIIFQAIWWVLDSYISPYRYEMENRLQSLAHGGVFLILVLAAVYYSAESDVQSNTSVDERTVAAFMVLIKVWPFDLYAPCQCVRACNQTPC